SQPTGAPLRHTRVPYPTLFRSDEEAEASLEATELVDRLRRLLGPLGFGFEPIARGQVSLVAAMGRRGYKVLVQLLSRTERVDWRSEEHTSELQSRENHVCRLLL